MTSNSLLHNMRTEMTTLPFAVLVPLLLIGITVESRLLVSDPEGDAVLDLHSCAVYEGLEAQDIRGPVRPAPPHIFHQLVSACKPSSRGDWPLIFPGTKWCGPGNRAENYYDLGSRVAEDTCCREHDHCPLVLDPGRCRHDVCNEYGVTLSHCSCDARFRRCLHAVGSDAADLIGWIYFNLVHVKCFKSRVPCDEFRGDCPIALHSVLPYQSGRSSSLTSALFGF